MQICILTGSIATGKSTISGFLKEKGFNVFCADTAVHQLYKEKHIVDMLRAICPDVVHDDEVDRKILASKIFDNDYLLKTVENIIHKEVRNLEITFLDYNLRERSPIVFIDMALYYEMGAPKMIGDHKIDKVILVTTDEDVQLKRAILRGGMEEAMINKIMKLQLPSEVKKRYADYVIDNNGSVEESKQQLELILKDIICN